MTGLQWAVLAAYARSLPPGPFCRQVEAAAQRGAPIDARQAVARTLADAAGLTSRGRVTPSGKLAALTVLRHLGIQDGPAAVASLFSEIP